MTSTSGGPQFVSRLMRLWFNGLQPKQLPSKYLQRLWFGTSPSLNTYLRTHYEHDLINYISHKSAQVESSSYIKLEKEPYGALCLTILMSELAPRIITDALTHPDTQSPLNEYELTDSSMLAEDAATLCWVNTSNEIDMQLPPIYRTFFITPLIRHRTTQSLLAAEQRCEEYMKMSGTGSSEVWARPWWQHMKEYVMKQQTALLLQQTDSKLNDNT